MRVLSLSFSFKERKISSDVVEGKDPYSKSCKAQPLAQEALQNARRHNPHHRNNVKVLFTNNSTGYALITTCEHATVKIAS